MNVSPFCARDLRNFLRTSGCSLPLPTHFPRQAGDVIMNGFITTTKALFNTNMTFTKAMSIGRNPLKSRGYHDDAFVSLNESLRHARALETICDGKEHAFTSPLVSFVKYETTVAENIAKTLPDDWPFFCNPDYSKAEKEIKADPR